MSDETPPRYLFLCQDDLSTLEERVNQEAANGYRLLQFQVSAEAHWEEGYPRTANGTETWYYAVMELLPPFESVGMTDADILNRLTLARGLLLAAKAEVLSLPVQREIQRALVFLCDAIRSLDGKAPLPAPTTYPLRDEG
jgi:hypothetical protein